MYLTWLDSNSWLIEMGGQHILLDPWLVGPLMFGNAAWFFKGDRPQPRPIPEPIDLILLSQGLEDHAHPPTLKALDRNIPVVGSPNAAQVARNLGYTQVTALAHHEKHRIGNLEILATVGSPVGPKTLENGYLLRDAIADTSLYYEPHGYHAAALKNLAPVDAILTPLITLEIPFLGPVIQGQKTAMQLVEWLQPQVVIPTSAGGDITFEGLLLKFLKASGTADEFRALLQQKGCNAVQVIEPTPGDRFALPLPDRVTT